MMLICFSSSGKNGLSISGWNAKKWHDHVQVRLLPVFYIVLLVNEKGSRRSIVPRQILSTRLYRTPIFVNHGTRQYAESFAQLSVPTLAADGVRLSQ